MAMEWDPKQYEKFLVQREAPFADLLGMVEKRPRMRVVDLGCGPGGLTRKLSDALDGADVLGFDNSAAMLEKAATQARPGLRFELRSIEQFVDGNEHVDLIFSNAALHWIADHEKLVPKLLDRLRPGGQLAVQVPSDDFNPVRATLAEVAGWRHRLHTLDIAVYANVLHAHGARDQVVFEKMYPHELRDADDILEWTKGTALLPYLEKLSEGQRGPFLEEVRKRLRVVFPGSPVFFPFRRVLFSARRA
jgi:trans-aconitate 2-methyltransferase